MGQFNEYMERYNFSFFIKAFREKGKLKSIEKAIFFFVRVIGILISVGF